MRFRTPDGKIRYNKVCENCFNPFVSSRVHAIYCGKECGRVGERISTRNAVPLPDPKKCRKCGEMHQDGNYFYCAPCHSMISDHFNMAEGVDGFEYAEDVTYTKRLNQHSQYHWGKGGAG